MANSIILRRRFRPALVLTIAASIVAIVLGILPSFSGEYDPPLAVLTATLIAVIWYSFFTYCALHREELGRLYHELGHDNNDNVLFRVSNPTTYRTIRFRALVLGQRNGAALPMPPELTSDYRGMLELRPGDTWKHIIQFPPAQGVAGAPYGPAVQLGEPERALFSTQVVWTDDLDDSDRDGPYFWAVPVIGRKPTRLIHVDQAAAEWTQLGGGKVPRLTA